MTDESLIFSLGDSEYCVSIDRINEIVETGELTAIPDAAEYVRGVMDLRGETTTIVDPRVVLNVEEDGSQHRVIIFESDDGPPQGWLVDEVHEVITVAEEDIESVSEDEVVNGVVRTDDRFVIWIDPTAVHSVDGQPA